MNPLLIRRRGMMMAAGGGILPPVPPLPSGYTRVTSVRGKTTLAVIHTSISGDNSNLRILLKAKKDNTYTGSASMYSAFFGNYTSESYEACRLITADMKSHAASVNLYCNMVVKSSSSVVVTDNAYDWHVYDCRHGIVIVDGVHTYTKTVVAGISNNRVIAFNTQSHLSPVNNNEVMTHFERFIIYDGNVMVLDYVPCVSQSNVVGFYDTVGNAFHGSRTSTPFYVDN